MTGCLIIHGYTGGPYELSPLIDHLKEVTDWQISVPVLTGHGDENLTDACFEDWLADGRRAIEALFEKCETVYVIGFSMGGMIASYLAATYPVKKLVLLSTARKYLSVKYLSTYVTDMIEDGFKGRLEENPVYLHYRNKIEAVPLSANIEFMKLVSYTKKYLPDVLAPTFIAQGQKDALVPADTAYDIYNELGSKDKEAVFFENSNHLICLGRDRFVLIKMIDAFLRK